LPVVACRSRTLSPVVNLKGDSYRLKGRSLGRVPGDGDDGGAGNA
jgi:hypothetical protein